MGTAKKSYVVLIIMVLFLASTAWGWSVWVRIHEKVEPLQPSIVEGAEPPKESEKNILNVMILGIDQLGNERARADSIIVMSYNQDTQEVALISIPRDSRVQIPGYGMDKINHAMAYKGEVALMKQTVENLLGVRIHHYIYTNFTGFKKMVDVLGGVTINVQKPMIHSDLYNPINIKAGTQRLNGTQALGYVRFRGDSQADFGRMRRQQEFLKVIAFETLQAKTLLRLPKILEQVATHVDRKSTRLNTSHH